LVILQFPQLGGHSLNSIKNGLDNGAHLNPLARKVHEDFKKFQKIVGTWGTISERAYYDIIQKKYPLSA